MFSLKQSKAINYYTKANAEAAADMLNATEEEEGVRYGVVHGVYGEWLVAVYDRSGLLGYVRG